MKPLARLSLLAALGDHIDRTDGVESAAVDVGAHGRRTPLLRWLVRAWALGLAGLPARSFRKGVELMPPVWSSFTDRTIKGSGRRSVSQYCYKIKGA